MKMSVSNHFRRAAFHHVKTRELAVKNSKACFPRVILSIAILCLKSVWGDHELHLHHVAPHPPTQV